MAVTPEVARCLYMATWVRLHTPHSIDDWSQGELTQAFSILRPPPVAFEVWLARCGIATEDPEAAANEAAVAILKGLNGEVKVEEHDAGTSD